MPGEKNTFPTRVLIVDDEQTVIDVLTVILKKHKLEARSVLSGEDAIALLEKERFGCLICDKNLPGKSGLDVIKEAKRLQPYCACLIMTGYPTAESMLEAMRSGAIDYLEKPFPELGLVVQRIGAAMEHARNAFEREALVRTLKEMRGKLKDFEEKAFQSQTELDVLQQVVELRVEEATRNLKVKNAQLLLEVQELRKAQKASKKEEAAPPAPTQEEPELNRQAIKAVATRASLAAEKPKLTVADAREALQSVAKSLEQLAGD
jgi:FixJ family two-component response regulator